jgi:hypothetical protein
VQHPTILTQDVGTEPVSAVPFGRAEDFTKQYASDAAVLPLIDYDQTEFDQTRVICRFVTSNSDRLDVRLGDQCQPSAVINV